MKLNKVTQDLEFFTNAALYAPMRSDQETSSFGKCLAVREMTTDIEWSLKMCAARSYEERPAVASGGHFHLPGSGQPPASIERLNKVSHDLIFLRNAVRCAPTKESPAEYALTSSQRLGNFVVIPPFGLCLTSQLSLTS